MNDALELPPVGHPLRKLGQRLTEFLNEDQWRECGALLLDGWAAGTKERAALLGLPEGALDGGWTASGIIAYAMRLEDALHTCSQVSESRRRKIDELIGALKRIAHGPWPDDCEGPEEQCRFDEGVAKAALKKVGAGNAQVTGDSPGFMAKRPVD